MEAVIRLKDIKDNVLLAKPVVLSNGYVLVQKGTVISEENAEKLMERGIKEVSIVADGFVKKDNDGYINEKIRPESKKTTEEYHQFKLMYDTQVDTAKEKITGFLEGEKVSMDEFYSVTGNILEKLNNKSELFSYMIYLKNNEEYTFNHCVNVSLLCNSFAQWCQMNENEKKNLTIAGLLHDIGKILIDPNILNKRGKLDDNEYMEIKQHTLKGYNMILDYDLPEEIKEAALMHHEKIDGTGYPLGLRDNEIGRFARIVSICDIYEAMTAERCYHPRNCPFDVIKDFEEKRFGLLDTRYLLIFLKNVAYNYLGSNVLLSDDTYAKVVFINNKRYSRPIVKCGDKYIDLMTRPELKIKEII